MSTVCAPPVAFVAVIASRSEIPSGPGLALREVAEETSPFTTSLVEVTVSTVGASSGDAVRAEPKGATTKNDSRTTPSAQIVAGRLLGRPRVGSVLD
jgi:hypothetical protein